VIFTHSDECVQVGTRRVKAAPAWNANKGPSAFTGEKVSSVHHSDGDGTESVEVWACVPGCPVRMLDGQSGKTKSTRSVVDHVPRPKSASIGGFAGKKDVVIVSDDDGGASRFFYTAKAGRAERDRGCDDLAPGAKGADALRDGGRSDGTVRSVGGGIHTEGVALAKNDHPTIKPQSLIRYFGKMILPPKRTDGKPRRILVPFSGSGSEMIALLQAGWDEVVGIEREAKYIRIADARIKKGEIFKDREKK
jgi:site-specific DNA-methyltransferase (adenine-specific)